MRYKQYLLELGAAMLLYAGTLVASLWALRGEAFGHEGVRLALSLAPMVPSLAICWAIMRQLRRLDELQVRIQMEALGLAFAATALLTFSYGFLENVGFPRLSMFAVWPLMAGCWMVGLVVASARYRSCATR
ncbi:hypothetical protein [Variovorax sp.]|uniref:hypothetical protein n=1 Tax=Variovorax sp. TaxID=1871043 RepID=UPI002D3622C4|nr:hypothetical protein [Variovorax sp.]HYP84140.1 hypothetical protein [Variovorax sp.]